MNTHDELEIRDLLREAGRVLIECSDHQLPREVPKHPMDNMFGDEDMKPTIVWETTESALKAQLVVEKIRSYLKTHPSESEESAVRRRQSDFYSI
jgi:hypothetical protein